MKIIRRAYGSKAQNSQYIHLNANIHREKKSRASTSHENWFPSLAITPRWRIVFINTRWRDWSRRTLKLVPTKIRIETNTACKLTSCMSWKLILLWGFSAIDSPVTERKKRQLIVSCHIKNIEWRKKEQRRFQPLFRQWFLVRTYFL